VAGRELFQRCGDARRWSVDGIAASNCVAWKRDDEVSGPTGGFVDRIVGAKQLGSAAEHGVAHGRVVDAGFFGV